MKHMADAAGKRNRFAEAFREGGNLVGLAGAAGLSLALLNPLPLLVGLVAEAAYLLFVPDSKWYESRLGKRFEEAVRQRREELKRRTLPLLSPSMQDRFARLEATRVQIYAQAADNQEQWFDEVLRKLDYLLEKFLLFASKEVQFQTYLRSIQSQVRGDQPGPAQRRAMEEARRQERGRRPGGGGIVGDLLTAFDLFEEPARGNGGGRRGSGGGVPAEAAPPVLSALMLARMAARRRSRSSIPPPAPGAAAVGGAGFATSASSSGGSSTTRLATFRSLSRRSIVVKTFRRSVSRWSVAATRRGGRPSDRAGRVLRAGASSSRSGRRRPRCRPAPARASERGSGH